MLAGASQRRDSGLGRLISILQHTSARVCHGVALKGCENVMEANTGNLVLRFVFSGENHLRAESCMDSFQIPYDLKEGIFLSHPGRP